MSGTSALGPPDVPTRLRPRPLEVGCGLALGMDPETEPLGRGASLHPREALDAAIRRALSRPPCLVSFSGGRDSSAVLACATEVARREGLAEPIPVTYRFAQARGSYEDEWQEQVIRHLGVSEWERVPMTTELDAVGPVAQAVMVRHGLLWPFNAHFHAPLLQRASGGSLLTGIGGDQLFGRQLWSSARALLSGHGHQRRVRGRSVGLAISPRPVQRWVLARRSPRRWPWLQPDAEAAVNRSLVDWQVRTPLSWRGAMGRWWRSRNRAALAASMDVLAGDARTEVVHPFMDAAVVASMANHFGRAGPSDRTAAMEELFGHILPGAVLARRSKAHFDEAFISEHSRAFASTWTGSHVDVELVDPDRLAQEWRSASPDPRSLLLMQAAWLARR